MNAITIRNLSDKASRALEVLAEENGTTTEAEAERILNDALATVELKPSPEVETPKEGLISAFQKLREKYPELEDIEFSRDQTPARGVSFE
ncbi:FitA-like ribbon-helix-helix domain-containing protein [Neorhizobium sp. DT-125]|uniref:FitA-like ribbon-helix-helix domain-containing protein n=1 Tax=Neorhizobium sp. DT-125 TaxID=3396163 RepID=UPI003F1A7219